MAAVETKILSALIELPSGEQIMMRVAELSEIELPEGARITLIDSVTGKAPEALVAKRLGNDLILEVDEEEVATLSDFFSTSGVAFYPEGDLGLAQDADAVITAESAVLSRDASGASLLWSADEAGTSAMAGGSYTPYVLGALAAGGVAAAAAGSGSSGSSSPAAPEESLEPESEPGSFDVVLEDGVLTLSGGHIYVEESDEGARFVNWSDFSAEDNIQRDGDDDQVVFPEGNDRDVKLITDDVTSVVIEDGLTLFVNKALIDNQEADEDLVISGEGNLWLLVGDINDQEVKDFTAQLNIELSGGSLTFDMPNDDYELTLLEGSVISLGGGTLEVSDGNIRLEPGVSIEGADTIILNSSLELSRVQLETLGANQVSGQGELIVTVNDDVEANSTYQFLAANNTLFPAENGPRVSLRSSTGTFEDTTIDIADIEASLREFFTKRTDQLNAEIDAAVARVANLDAALTGDIAEVAGDLAALQGVVTTLSGTVEANKTELQGNIDTVQSNLDAAISALTDTLNTEVARLEGLIGGNFDDIIQVANDLAILQGAVTDLSATVDDNKTELQQNIDDVRGNLGEAIRNLTTTLNTQVARLEGLIGDNAADITQVASDLAALDGVVAALSGTVDANDVAQTAALDAARASLEAMIADLSDRVTNEVSRLESEIAQLDTALSVDIAQVAADLATLQGVVTDLSATVDDNKTELQGNIDTVQSNLDAAISALTDTLNTEVARLEGLIGDNAADITQVASDLAALDGVVAALSDTVDANDAAQTQALADAKTALEGMIDALSDRVTNEVTRLEGELADLDSALTADIAQVASDLAALDGLVAALSDTVDANDLAQTQALADAKTALEGMIDALSDRVTSEVTRLESEIAQLDTDLSVDIAQVAADLATLQGAVTDLSVTVDDNMTELQGNIDTVQSNLDAAIRNLTTTLNTEVARLEGLIGDNAADITQVASDLAALDGVVAALSDTVDANDAAQTQALADAKTALEGMIDALSDRVTNEVTRLEGELADLDSALTADIAQVASDLAALDGLVAALSDTVDANDLAQTQALADAKTALEGMIDALSDRVTSEVTRLESEIAQLDTDLSVDIAQVAADLATLQGAVTDLSVTVDDNMTELQGNIDTVQSNLDAAISALTDTLNTEVARLEGLIDGNADDITQVANDLATLQDVVTDLSATVDANKTELQGNIDAVQANLDGVSQALEARLAELADALQGAGLPQTVAEVTALEAGDPILSNYRLVDSASNLLNVAEGADLLTNAKAIIVNDGAELTATEVNELAARGVDFAASTYSLTGSGADLAELDAGVLNGATDITASGTTQYAYAVVLMRAGNGGTTEIAELSVNAGQKASLQYDANDVVIDKVVSGSFVERVLDLTHTPIETNITFNGRSGNETLILPEGPDGDAPGVLDIDMGAGSDTVVLYGGPGADDSRILTDDSTIELGSGSNTLLLVGTVDVSAATVQATGGTFNVISQAGSAPRITLSDEQLQAAESIQGDGETVVEVVRRADGEGRETVNLSTKTVSGVKTLEIGNNVTAELSFEQVRTLNVIERRPETEQGEDEGQLKVTFDGIINIDEEVDLSELQIDETAGANTPTIVLGVNGVLTLTSAQADALAKAGVDVTGAGKVIITGAIDIDADLSALKAATLEIAEPISVAQSNALFEARGDEFDFDFDLKDTAENLADAGAAGDAATDIEATTAATVAEAVAIAALANDGDTTYDVTDTALAVADGLAESAAALEAAGKIIVTTAEVDAAQAAALEAAVDNADVNLAAVDLTYTVSDTIANLLAQADEAFANATAIEIIDDVTVGQLNNLTGAGGTHNGQVEFDKLTFNLKDLDTDKAALGIDDTLTATTGDELLILGKLLRLEDDGSVSNVTEKSTLAVDPRAFVLKNLADAYVGGNINGELKAAFAGLEDALGSADFGSDTVALDVAPGLGNTAIHGATLGTQAGRGDTLRFTDLTDFAALDARASSVELAKNLSAYGETFDDKEFLSLKLNLSNGDSIALVDIVALDLQVGPQGETVAQLLSPLGGDAIGEGSYAAPISQLGDVADLLALITPNLRFVMDDVNEAETPSELETALASLAQAFDAEGAVDLDLTDFGVLVEGRQQALLNDLLANRPQGGYADADAVIDIFAPLVTFREAVQEAVEAAESGTLAAAELTAVRDTFAALDGKTVNGAVVDGDAATTSFNALIDRIGELADGRYAALQTDLSANDYGSFTAMIGLFDELLTFRETVQEAVEAAEGGTLAAAELEAVRDTFAALDGKTVNGAVVDGDAATSSFDALIDRIGELEAGRYTALQNDLSANDYGSFTAMIGLFDELLTFRETVQEAVEAAEGGTLAAAELEAVRDTLAALDGKTVNGAVVDGDAATSSFDALIDRIGELEAGRYTALQTDLSANDYGSFTAMIGLFDELLTFRETVQEAVEAAEGGTLAAAELEAVRDTLAALDGKTVNGAVVDADTATTGFDALIGRIGELEAGRYVALQNDLSANDYGSFTAMIGLFDELLTFRETVQEAVEAAEGGTLAAAELEAVRDTLAALDGKTVNGAVVDGDAATSSFDALIDRIGELEAGRYTALQTDLSANDYGSFTAMIGLFDELLTFRETVQEAVEAAEGGTLAAAELEAVRDTLAALDGKTVNGAVVDADTATTGFDALIGRIGELEAGRYVALQNDLSANDYGSFTAMIGLFDELLTFRETVQEAVEAAEGGTLAAAELEAVRDTLAALDGKTVNGAVVDGDAATSSFDALIGRIGELEAGRYAALQTDLSANDYGSFTAMIGLFDELLTFREAVQEAVEAAEGGTLAAAELEAVRDTFAALDGKTVNGKMVDGDAATPSFDALIGRIGELEAGRYAALQTDLSANDYGSFTAMIGLFDELLTFREAVQDAVENGNEGTLSVDDLQAVAATLTALKGKTVNGHEVTEAGLEAAQAGVDRLDSLVEGRFEALAADLAANGPYTSFEALSVDLNLLEAFRTAVQEVVVNANDGDSALTLELFRDVADALGNLEGKTLNGEPLTFAQVDAALTQFEELSDVRQEAIFEALNGGDYASFTQLLLAVEPAALSVALDAVNAAETVAEMAAIQEDIFVYATGASVEGFNALNEPRQEAVLQGVIDERPEGGYPSVDAVSLEFQAQVDDIERVDQAFLVTIDDSISPASIAFSGDNDGPVTVNIAANGEASFVRGDIQAFDSAANIFTARLETDPEVDGDAAAKDFIVNLTGTAANNEFVFKAPDANSIEFNGNLGAGTNKVVVRLDDPTPGVFDTREIRLDLSGVEGNRSELEFRFPNSSRNTDVSDEKDELTFTLDTNILGFDAYTVFAGEVEFTRTDIIDGQIVQTDFLPSGVSPSFSSGGTFGLSGLINTGGILSLTDAAEVTLRIPADQIDDLIAFLDDPGAFKLIGSTIRVEVLTIEDNTIVRTPLADYVAAADGVSDEIVDQVFGGFDAISYSGLVNIDGGLLPGDYDSLKALSDALKTLEGVVGENESEDPTGLFLLLQQLDTRLTGELNQAVMELEGSIQDLDDALQAQIDDNADDISANVTALGELTTLVGTITDAAGDGSNVGAELDALQGQLDGITDTVVAYVDGKVADLQGQIDGLTIDDIADLTGELADLNAAVTALQTLTGEGGAIDQRLVALEGQLDGITDTVVAYVDGKVADLQGQIDGLAIDDIVDLTGELADLNAAVTALQALTGKGGEVDTRLGELEAAIDALTPPELEDFDSEPELVRSVEQIFGTTTGSTTVLNSFVEGFEADTAGFKPETVELTVTGDLTVAQAVALAQAGLSVNSDNVTYSIRDAYTTIQSALTNPQANAALAGAEEVVAFGNNNPNGIDMMAIGDSINLRIEAEGGDDTIFSGPGGHTIVGGLGGDTIWLTEDEGSEDTIVYQTIFDGRTLPVTTVTFSSDSDEYREGSVLTLTINGKIFEHTITTTNLQAEQALKEFAEKILADQKVVAPEEAIVGLTVNPLTEAQTPVSLADMTDGKYVVPSNSIFVPIGAAALLLDGFFAGDLGPEVNGGSGFESLLFFASLFSTPGGATYSLTDEVFVSVQKLAEILSDEDASLGNELQGFPEAIAISPALLRTILEDFYGDAIHDPQFNEILAEINLNLEADVDLRDAFVTVGVDENDDPIHQLKLLGQLDRALDVGSGSGDGDSRVQLIENDGQKTEWEVTFPDTIDGWPTRTNEGNNTPFDRSVSVEIDVDGTSTTVTSDVVFNGGFVLKNVSDAFIGGDTDGFEKSSFDPVDINSILEFFDDHEVVVDTTELAAGQTLSIHGLTIGQDVVRFIDHTDVNPIEEFAGKIASVEFARSLTNYNEVFDDKDLISVRLNFADGGSIELVDLIGEDAIPAGELADLIGERAGEGGYGLPVTDNGQTEMLLAAISSSIGFGLETVDSNLKEVLAPTAGRVVLGPILKPVGDDKFGLGDVQDLEIHLADIDATLEALKAAINDNTGVNTALVATVDDNVLTLTANEVGENTFAVTAAAVEQNGVQQVSEVTFSVDADDYYEGGKLRLLIEGADPIEADMLAGDPSGSVEALLQAVLAAKPEAIESVDTVVAGVFDPTVAQTLVFEVTLADGRELRYEFFNTGTGPTPPFGSSPGFATYNLSNGSLTIDGVSVPLESPATGLMSVQDGEIIGLSAPLQEQGSGFPYTVTVSDSSATVFLGTTPGESIDGSAFLASAQDNLPLTAAGPGKLGIQLTAATEGPDPLQATGELDFAGEFQQATIPLFPEGDYAVFSDGDATDRGAPVFFEGGKVWLTITPVDAQGAGGNPVVVSANMQGIDPATLVLEVGNTVDEDSTVSGDTIRLFQQIGGPLSETNFSETVDIENITTVADLLSALRDVPQVASAELVDGAIRIVATEEKVQFFLQVTGNEDFVVGDTTFPKFDAQDTANTLFFSTVAGNVDPAQALVNAIQSELQPAQSAQPAQIVIEGNFSEDDPLVTEATASAIPSVVINSFGFVGGFVVETTGQDGFFIATNPLLPTPQIGDEDTPATIGLLLDYLVEQRQGSIVDSAVIDENGNIVITATDGVDTLDLSITLPALFGGVTTTFEGQGVDAADAGSLVGVLKNAEVSGSGEIMLTAATPGKQLFTVEDVRLDYAGVTQLATVSLSDSGNYTTGSQGDDFATNLTGRDAPSVYFEGGKVWLEIESGDGQETVTVSADMVLSADPAKLIINVPDIEPTTKVDGSSFQLYQVIDGSNVGEGSVSLSGILDVSELLNVLEQQSIIDTAKLIDGGIEITAMPGIGQFAFSPMGRSLKIGEGTDETEIAAQIRFSSLPVDTSEVSTAEALVEAINAQTGVGGALENLIAAATQDGTTITLEGANPGEQTFSVSDIRLDYQGAQQAATVDFSGFTPFASGEVSLTITETGGQGRTETFSAATVDDLVTAISGATGGVSPARVALGSGLTGTEDVFFDDGIFGPDFRVSLTVTVDGTEANYTLGVAPSDDDVRFFLEKDFEIVENVSGPALETSLSDFVSFFNPLLEEDAITLAVNEGSLVVTANPVGAELVELNARVSGDRGSVIGTGTEGSATSTAGGSLDGLISAVSKVGNEITLVSADSVREQFTISAGTYDLDGQPEETTVTFASGDAAYFESGINSDTGKVSISVGQQVFTVNMQDTLEGTLNALMDELATGTGFGASRGLESNQFTITGDAGNFAPLNITAFQSKDAVQQVTSLSIDGSDDDYFAGIGREVSVTIAGVEFLIDGDTRLELLEDLEAKLEAAIDNDTDGTGISSVLDIAGISLSAGDTPTLTLTAKIGGVDPLNVTGLTRADINEDESTEQVIRVGFDSGFVEGLSVGETLRVEFGNTSAEYTVASNDTAAAIIEKLAEDAAAKGAIEIAVDTFSGEAGLYFITVTAAVPGANVLGTVASGAANTVRAFRDNGTSIELGPEFTAREITPGKFEPATDCTADVGSISSVTDGANFIELDTITPNIDQTAKGVDTENADRTNPADDSGLFGDAPTFKPVADAEDAAPDGNHRVFAPDGGGIVTLGPVYVDSEGDFVVGDITDLSDSTKDAFVIKNKSDVDDSPDSPISESFAAEFGNDEVLISASALGSGDTLKIYGFTLGTDAGRGDLVRFLGLKDDEDLLSQIESVQFAKGLTAYADIFQKREFISLKLNLEGGGSIEFIDLISATAAGETVADLAGEGAYGTPVDDSNNVAELLLLIAPNLAFGLDGVRQTFENPGDSYTADAFSAAEGTTGNGNATLRGDDAEDQAVRQSFVNPENGYEATPDSPVENAGGSTDGDGTLFGSAPGVISEDGLTTTFLSGVTEPGSPEDGAETLYTEDSDGRDLTALINALSVTAGADAEVDDQSVDTVREGFDPFEWGDGEGEAEVTVLSLGNAEPDVIHNFQVDQDLIVLEGALEASTKVGQVEGVVSTFAFADNFPFDLSNDEFGLITGAASGTDLGDAGAIADLLNNHFSFSSNAESEEINTSIFAITGSDDDSLTAIWAHEQSSADDGTVEAAELYKLALVNTVGGSFSLDNFGADEKEQNIV
ncbi:hypothetical protein [Ectothiorhodospira sp. BSL-9]|uniref:hypothetical protein n=1 Tax=Ectothiorhodospira sp. BSL-9 TaxID=1442136 RepID=UPI0007B43871|nr:hypothetical protein [Ectothiorhodospira sp. BSL-9]ANB03168.1 hypothetical protein ECTOBSL9_2754 [Ectothiorhodospira sp. BSL-9]